MKKAIWLLVIGYWLLVIYSPSFAQEEESTSPTKTKKVVATETPVPTEKPSKSKVEEIKEKIASTVAQLNLVSKKAFVGQISKLEKNQIAIEKNGEIKIIDVDELTKYYEVDNEGKRAEIKFSQLDIGHSIVTIGLHNKESRKLLARIVLVKEIHIHINGLVREVDIKDGTITVEDKKREKTFTVDVEKTTTIKIYTKAQGLVKSGLSKIEIGQRAHVTATRNQKEEDRIAADRILLLPGKAVGIISPPSAAGPKEATSEASPTTKPTATPKPKKPTPTSPPDGGEIP